MIQELHAAAGGQPGYNGRLYRGGEFLPFYVPRPKMPQVDVKDYPGLKEWLAAQGVATYNEFFSPGELRAHQRVDMKNVLAMPEAVKNIQVLTSLDRYILDGNHRWWGHVIDKTQVPALVVARGFDEALDLLLAFPGTTHDNREG